LERGASHREEWNNEISKRLEALSKDKELKEILEDDHVKMLNERLGELNFRLKPVENDLNFRREFKVSMASVLFLQLVAFSQNIFCLLSVKVFENDPRFEIIWLTITVSILLVVIYSLFRVCYSCLR